MRRTPLSRTTPLPARTSPMPRFKVIDGDGAAIIPFPSRKPARDTIPARVRRIVTERDMGLCVHCAAPAVHQHHRRLKGIGGDTRDHTDCPCAIVSVCPASHELAHRDRFVALAEGLIVPRATPLPGLLPVLVHGLEDGSGVRAWPTCDGRWVSYEPDGDGAA